jgi:hypothetical protein
LCQLFTTFEAAVTANALCYLLLYQQQQVRVLTLALEASSDRFSVVGSFPFLFRRRLLLVACFGGL